MTRVKSATLQGLIGELIQIAEEQKVPAWKAVAKGLSRSTRRRYEISLATIAKTARKQEIVVVPGSVLSAGELTEPLTIAALKVSQTAREKITKSGGKILTINDVLKENPKAKGVRIMG